MGYLTMRYFLSLGNVAASLFLGAVLFVLCAIYSPTMLNDIFVYAGTIREWFLSMVTNPHLKVGLRPVLHENSIVLMLFTLVSRMIVGAFIAIGAWFVSLIRGDDLEPRRR